MVISFYKHNSIKVVHVLKVRTFLPQLRVKDFPEFKIYIISTRTLKFYLRDFEWQQFKVNEFAKFIVNIIHTQDRAQQILVKRHNSKCFKRSDFLLGTTSERLLYVKWGNRRKLHGGSRSLADPEREGGRGSGVRNTPFL